MSNMKPHKINHEITEEKLQRDDSFRIQVQPRSRAEKLYWASTYNFISDIRPSIAKRRRDHSGSEIVKGVAADWRTMKDTNPNVVNEHKKWLKENIHDPKILRETFELHGYNDISMY
jgi:hypothetical protein